MTIKKVSSIAKLKDLGHIQLSKSLFMRDFQIHSSHRDLSDLIVSLNLILKSPLKHHLAYLLKPITLNTFYCF